MMKAIAPPARPKPKLRRKDAITKRDQAIVDTLNSIFISIFFHVKVAAKAGYEPTIPASNPAFYLNYFALEINRALQQNLRVEISHFSCRGHFLWQKELPPLS